MALAVGGFVFAAAAMWSMAVIGGWQPGNDAGVWDRVGDEVRAGISPYYATIPGGPGGFFYAPPWAVLFALVSWLPLPVLQAVILACELAALRYVAGSWLRAGLLCWVPIVPLELYGGSLNLVMAAAIAAAIRGVPESAVALAMAKLSPTLAIDARQWRRAVIATGVLIAVTVPVLGYWPEWIAQLARSYGTNVVGAGSMLDVPLLPRLGIAGVLVVLAWWRGWPRMRGLAAIIATPALYWVSGVLLFALIPEPRTDAGRAGDAGQPTMRYRAAAPARSVPGVEVLP